MSDYRHCYCDLPKGYSLDTINGIASAGTAAYGRVAGTQNTHRIEVRNHRLWLIIIFLCHNSQIYPIKQNPLYIVHLSFVHYFTTCPCASYICSPRMIYSTPSIMTLVLCTLSPCTFSTPVGICAGPPICAGIPRRTGIPAD